MKDLQLKDKRLLYAILAENKKQIEKWGIQDHDPADWLMFATEEIGELAEAMADYKFRNGNNLNVAREAIQAATLTLKIAEMFLNIEESKLKQIVTCEECGKVDVFEYEEEAETYGWEFIEDTYNIINYWFCDKCSHN